MTQPIRVLHFADIHIGMENYGKIDPESGMNQRVLDFVSRLKEIVDYAIEHEADAVIFAGDAFKTRDPNPTYQRAFARQIVRLSKAGIPTVMLVGNHDIPLMEQRASSIDIFATLDVPNIIVARTERLHCIETKRGVLQVATVPWPQRSRLMQQDEFRGRSIESLDEEMEKALADQIKILADEIDPSVPAILTGHFTVSGAAFGSERSVMLGRDLPVKLGSLALDAWDYVAMGHIHKHQNANKDRYPAVVYSGSLERIDFGEESEAKGFCWVNVIRGATTWEFMKMDVRRFVSIFADATNDGETPTDAVIRAIERHDVKDAIVRVRVKLLQSQEPMFRPREVEHALNEAYLVAGIARDIQRDTRSRIGLESPEMLTPEQLLDAYLLSKGRRRDEVDALMKTAKGLMAD
jgi:exonuclease SbcD